MQVAFYIIAGKRFVCLFKQLPYETRTAIIYHLTACNIIFL